MVLKTYNILDLIYNMLTKITNLHLWTRTNQYDVMFFSREHDKYINEIQLLHLALIDQIVLDACEISKVLEVGSVPFNLYFVVEPLPLMYTNSSIYEWATPNILCME